MPPSLTDRTACTGMELLSCELLANPIAVADALVHKTPLSRRKARVKTLGRPLLSLYGCPLLYNVLAYPAAVLFPAAILSC